MGVKHTLWKLAMGCLPTKAESNAIIDKVIDDSITIEFLRAQVALRDGVVEKRLKYENVQTEQDQTIATLRAEVAYEQERNANNVAIKDEQIAALWKEIDGLRRALKYCQDDKEVMQNEIDLLEAKRCDDFLPKPDKLILVDGTK